MIKQVVNKSSKVRQAYVEEESKANNELIPETPRYPSPSGLPVAPVRGPSKYLRDAHPLQELYFWEDTVHDFANLWTEGCHRQPQIANVCRAFTPLNLTQPKGSSPHFSAEYHDIRLGTKDNIFFDQSVCQMV